MPGTYNKKTISQLIAIHGNGYKAAIALGISSQSFYGAMKRYGVEATGNIPVGRCLASNDKKNGPCGVYRDGKFCSRHRHHYQKRFIDEYGKNLVFPIHSKPGSIPVTTCKLENKFKKCGKYSKRGLCTVHLNLVNKGYLNENGKLLKKLPIHKPGCVAKGKTGTGECTNYVNGKFCQRHYMQFYRGILDCNGNKKRNLIIGPKKVYQQCVAKDKAGDTCGTYHGGRFCSKHRFQFLANIIDKDGNKLRRKYKEKVPCSVPGCKHMSGGLTLLCRFHYKDIIQKNNFHKYPHLMKAPKGKEMPIQDITWEV